jgi:hypothetical protein
VSLAEQIIDGGPYVAGDVMPGWMHQPTAVGWNELREELLELRRLRARAEARERFDIDLFGAGVAGWLHCDRCSWQIQLGNTTGLAELNRRADEHTEVCR